MEKMIVDGKVAVLYSPGYGAGWYTWNTTEGQQIVFDADIINDVLAGKDPTQTAEQKYPNAYSGGCYKLEVKWLPIGTRFQIDEYDGNESVRILSPEDGFVA